MKKVKNSTEIMASPKTIRTPKQAEKVEKQCHFIRWQRAEVLARLYTY